MSQLQESGDHIISLHDVNPYLEVAIQEIEAQNPGHYALPYYSIKDNPCLCPAKCSVVLVPTKILRNKPSLSQFVSMMENEALLLSKGCCSQQQHQLNALKTHMNLKVVALEDFFADQMKSHMQQTGYKVDSYYTATFTAEKDFPPEMKQDLLHRQVTDYASLRQWRLDDPNLLRALAAKHLHIPASFDASFLEDMHNKNLRIQGAEILVIRGTKI